MTHRQRMAHRLVRCLALVATGGAVFQTGGCAADLLTVTLQNTFLTYLADAVQIFFYNVFNL